MIIPLTHSRSKSWPLWYNNSTPTHVLLERLGRAHAGHCSHLASTPKVGILHSIGPRITQGAPSTLYPTMWYLSPSTQPLGPLGLLLYNQPSPLFLQMLLSTSTHLPLHLLPQREPVSSTCSGMSCPFPDCPRISAWKKD